MENKDSPEEYGELTYRKMDVPIITSQALGSVVNLFLSAITDDQWILLVADHIDFDTFILLDDMCHEVTNIITAWILDVMEPQIQNWMSTDAARDHNMRHYYSLTEDNVKASIGNSFDRCFGEVTGFPQERSNESIALLELIAAEVKKRVNQSLAGLISSAGQSASCPQIESTESTESYDFDTPRMVYQAGSILKYLLKSDTESSKSQENPCAVTSEDCCPNKVASIEHSSPQDLDPKEPSPEDINPQDLDPKEPSPEDTTMCPVPKTQSSSHQVLCSAKGTEEENMEKEFSPTSPKPTGSIQQAFMAFFNRKTSKVIPACDLNTSVSHSYRAHYCDTTIMFPEPNMQRSDGQSEETVNGISNELPNNSPPKNRSFGHKLRTFFRRKTSTVTPGCDLNTSEDQGSLCGVSRNNVSQDEIKEVEEVCSEASVTPTCENGPTQSSKLSGIMRILSSTGKILMKPFTCCISAER